MIHLFLRLLQELTREAIEIEARSSNLMCVCFGDSNAENKRGA